MLRRYRKGKTGEARVEKDVPAMELPLDSAMCRGRSRRLLSQVTGLGRLGRGS